MVRSLPALAALALLLASASAAPLASPCSAGSFSLAALSVSAPAVASSNFAKCYGSMMIDVTTSCKVTVTAIAPAGVSIPGLFGDSPYTDYASW